MRVIAGSARSIRLVFPKGAPTRPTSDLVRESLFASLADRTLDCQFADLYSGSGSVGIEALSRGAARCVFLERDHRCLEALRTNLANTRLAERARIAKGDCRKLVPALWAEGPWDIVFLDPPYREDASALVRQVLDLAAGADHPCLVILQCERGMEPELPPDRSRRYGGTMLLFYEYPSAADATSAGAG
jgi:16S rRNA (guanine(966)-N(2))-methyltransferase RsmD